MSRRRATRPLIKYSLCPLRYKRRLTTTSPGLVTSTGFSDLFLRLPFKSSGWPSSPEAPDSDSSEEGAAEGPPSRRVSVWGCAGTSAKISFGSGEVASESGAPAGPSAVPDPRTKRAASASSGSSRVIVTSAKPIGGRFTVPLKMQSLMRPARRDLWLCSPRTQLMASTTLDLPQPFGPTMQVVPVPLKVTTVRSQNDLKPVISTLRSLSKLSPLVSQNNRAVHDGRQGGQTHQREERRLSVARWRVSSREARTALAVKAVCQDR